MREIAMILCYHFSYTLLDSYIIGHKQKILSELKNSSVVELLLDDNFLLIFFFVSSSLSQVV